MLVFCRSKLTIVADLRVIHNKINAGDVRIALVIHDWPRLVLWW